MPEIWILQKYMHTVLECEASTKRLETRTNALLRSQRKCQRLEDEKIALLELEYKHRERELKDCTKYRAKAVAQRYRASTSSHRHAGRTRTKRIFSEQRLKMYIHNDS